jgi:uncharacterized membrane protein YtjA (UPF0391 family)
LTGVIQSSRSPRYRRDLFLSGRDFSLPSRLEAAGTFVPRGDYFIECVSARSVGAGIKIAELVMLSWVVTFLIIALIAGILGFGGIAGVSIEIAKAIFFIAVVLFIISAVVGLARGRTRV